MDVLENIGSIPVAEVMPEVCTTTELTSTNTILVISERLVEKETLGIYNKLGQNNVHVVPNLSIVLSVGYEELPS